MLAHTGVIVHQLAHLCLLGAFRSDDLLGLLDTRGDAVGFAGAGIQFDAQGDQREHQPIGVDNNDHPQAWMRITEDIATMLAGFHKWADVATKMIDNIDPVMRYRIHHGFGICHSLIVFGNGIVFIVDEKNVFFCIMPVHGNRHGPC